MSKESGQVWGCLSKAGQYGRHRLPDMGWKNLLAAFCRITCLNHYKYDRIFITKKRIEYDISTCYPITDYTKFLEKKISGSSEE